MGMVRFSQRSPSPHASRPRQWPVRPRSRSTFIDDLSLNYDLTTLDTIEQIDVLWLKRKVYRARVRGRTHDSRIFWPTENGGFACFTAKYEHSPSHRCPR